MSAALEIDIQWARKEIVDLRAHVRALTVELQQARMNKRDHERFIDKLADALREDQWDAISTLITDAYLQLHGPRD